ncbi:hypothetical protein Pla175_15130 [Pirellulimonas nuda]|uniref:Uncharacterized protein n=1 Tax=Pirellulimonas nuda TaxID=2528009 RepID=A0A518D9H5_9BACT|nr:hypothetical protein [Pirellulimonas nuda]QDU88142.1 hypothetical protein Pla175_15130 [Pirellulimonas nuda]
MKRLLRPIAMVAAAGTLVWLHGCGKPEGGSLAEQRRLQSERAAVVATEQADAKADAAAKAQEAEAERLKDEAPSLVTEDDFKKGKSLKDGGYLSQVARARFVAEHRIAMDIQLVQAMALFNASEGRYPKDQKEFMEKIIKANMIQLPELDGPYEYVYNAEDHQLYKQPITEE